VRVHDKGMRFLSESRAAGAGFRTNDDWHVEEDALAAPAARLGTGLVWSPQ
jgi:hypothetical protein